MKNNEWIPLNDKHLEHPNIFEILNDELNKKIVGEHSARKAILLVANGKNVANPCEKASYNLLVGGSSGVGKDHVTKNTLEILPQEETIKRRRITKKVFAYWHNAKFEPTWTWDKKVFYCEDIPNSVLNEDVFKVMLSSGNATSTIVINQRAVDIEINGKPCIIVTIAEADPKNENLRRLPNIELDESVNQTKEIMKRQSMFAKEGKSFEYDKELTDSLKLLRRVKVKIPFADKIAQHFPTDHHIMRTNFSRFLDYIKSSVALHQYQREKDSDDYFLAIEQDYEIARECFTKTISSKNLIPISSNQKKILKVVRENEITRFSVNDIETKITFMNDRNLRKNLDKLTEFGFFTKDSEKLDGIPKPVIFYVYIDSPNFKIPSYTDIMTNRTTETNKTIKTNTTNSGVNVANVANVVKVCDTHFGKAAEKSVK